MTERYFLLNDNGAQPLAMDRAVAHLRANSEGLAFDRATVRSYDRDGRLHVELTNISKANVCPYIGREIPDWQGLNLDPDRVYQLLRDPEELARAAATFNNLPVLSKHVPVTVIEPHQEAVVGSTGTDAVFEAPYLKNSMVIWTVEAIEEIESDAKKQLSSAYRYRADMTPGTFQGVKYDGVMRDIVGNHVALVKEGRAGADVVVGDSLEELAMARSKVTMRGALTHGALVAYLAPKLASDAKIDLKPVLRGLTSKNYAAKRDEIAGKIRGLVNGNLAQDANIDDLIALLDAMGSVPVEEDAEPEALDPNGAVPVKEEDEDVDGGESGEEGDPDLTKKPAIDADALAAAKKFLAGKLSEDDMEQLEQLLSGSEGAADDEEDGDDLKPAKDAENDEMKNMVTKPAMDAAINEAIERTRKTEREIRAAERAVRPIVGEMVGAFDSAEAVYKKACETVGIKTEGVHPSAYASLLDMHRTASRPARPAAQMGMDEAASKSFLDRMPGAANIRVL